MCVCVWDEICVADYDVNKKCNGIKLENMYDMLQHESSNKYEKALASVSPACDVAHDHSNVLDIKQRG